MNTKGLPKLRQFRWAAAQGRQVMRSHASAMPALVLLASHRPTSRPLPCVDGSHEWDDEQRGHAEEWHDSSSASITVDFEKCLKCGR